jgi:methylthioribose-1-phosphate isomerase
MNFAAYDRVRAVRFDTHTLTLLDQRVLPLETRYLDCTDVAAVIASIVNLTVRGAPAIGIAAAYGVVISALNARGSEVERVRQITQDCAALNAARPTAVNLAWALARMRECLIVSGPDPAPLLARARQIEAEDLAANHRMGKIGAELIAVGSGVLTHCNTGSLATAGFGTALGVIRAGVAMQRITQVFASETRPWLQGARLTAWELLQDGIPAKLIADGAGAYLMSTGAVQWLIVGADRICANGDTANKIGTLSHAAAAKHFGVKVMVVAPSSTFDAQTATGKDIHIEERNPDELLE